MEFHETQHGCPTFAAVSSPLRWDTYIYKPLITTGLLRIGRLVKHGAPVLPSHLRYFFNPSASTTLSSTRAGWPSSLNTTPKLPR